MKNVFRFCLLLLSTQAVAQVDPGGLEYQKALICKKIVIDFPEKIPGRIFDEKCDYCRGPRSSISLDRAWYIVTIETPTGRLYCQARLSEANNQSHTPKVAVRCGYSHNRGD